MSLIPIVIMGILICAGIYVTTTTIINERTDGTDEPKDGINEETDNEKTTNEQKVEGNTENEPSAIYEGCYNDGDRRRFGDPSGRIKIIYVENHNIAECVKYCKQGGYQYMGLRNDNECQCDNDWDKITGLGVADARQCGSNAYGCWGGSMTNCIYDLQKM